MGLIRALVNSLTGSPNDQHNQRQQLHYAQPGPMVQYADDKGQYQHVQRSQAPSSQVGYHYHSAPVVQQRGGCYRGKCERRAERAERRVERAEYRAERRAARCCGGHRHGCCGKSRRRYHDEQVVVAVAPPVVMASPPARASREAPVQRDSSIRERSSAAEAQSTGVMPPAYEEAVKGEKPRSGFSLWAS